MLRLPSRGALERVFSPAAGAVRCAMAVSHFHACPRVGAGGPGWFHSPCNRRTMSRLRILPLAFLGRSETTSMRRGHL
jgi:hypothetical protein